MKQEYRIYYRFGLYCVNSVSIGDGYSNEFTEMTFATLQEALQYLENKVPSQHGVRIV